MLTIVRADYIPTRKALAVGFSTGLQLWIPADRLLAVKADLDPSFAGLRINRLSLEWGPDGKSSLHLAELLQSGLGEAVATALAEQNRLQVVPCSAFCSSLA